MKIHLTISIMFLMISSMILLSCSPKSEIGFAEVNGTSLYYELKGNGTPLVFMHGFALDMRFWDSQIEKFASDYTILRYDFRGFGKSQIPDTSQSYSHHEDLEALLDYLDLEKVVLIGHSMGGYPAFRFAYDYPERVQALILAEGHPIITKIYSNPESKELGGMFRHVAKVAKESGVEARRLALLDISISKWALANPTSSTLFRQMVEEYSGWHWINKDSQIIPKAVKIEKLSDLLLPVLLINGDLAHKSYHLSLKQIHDQLPNSKRIILKNSGHMLSLENPTQFNNELVTFLIENEIE